MRSAARAWRRRGHDRHPRHLPDPRDAGAPSGPRRFRVRDAGTGVGRDQPVRHDEQKRALPAARRARRRRSRRSRCRSRTPAPMWRRWQCAARRDGDEYVINGEKTWISNGGIADFYVVFARTGEAARRARHLGVHRRRRRAGLRDRRAHRRDRAASARRDGVQGMPRPRGATDRQGGEGFKVAMRRWTCSAVGGGGGARLRAACARRSAAHARDARHVRRHTGRSSVDPGETGATWRRRSTPPRCWPIAPPGSATQGRRVTREAAMAKLHGDRNGAAGDRRAQCRCSAASG